MNILFLPKNVWFIDVIDSSVVDSLFTVAHIVSRGIVFGTCFCFAVFSVHSSFAIISLGCFACIIVVICLLVWIGSSSWCRGLLCRV